MEQELRQAVEIATNRAQATEAVQRLYADVATEVAQRRPRCLMSGRCCQFEEFGHRLYVTTLELAAFVNDLPMADAMPESLRQAIASWSGTGCPFQVGKLCGAHALRPFGCRMFFCDAESQQWQQETYERFHARLKRLHEELDVPYFYVEWREALRAVVLSHLSFPRV